MKMKRCKYCKTRFIPNKRLGNRQVTCGLEECKKQHNKHSQKKWRKKNPNYNKDRYSVTKHCSSRTPESSNEWTYFNSNTIMKIIFNYILENFKKEHEDKIKRIENDLTKNCFYKEISSMPKSLSFTEKIQYIFEKKFGKCQL
jgi:hypothetical protein